MKYRGIIFDMDGTLLDSMGNWRRIGTICLRYLGKETDDPDFDRSVFRMDTAGVMQLFARHGIVFRNREEYTDAYYRAIRPYYEEVRPLPGVREFLERQKAAGIRMCVATATRSSVSQPVLERLGLMRYFEFLLCCSDVGAGKDKPDIYLRAAEKLGLSVAETLVFEDAPYCIRTAKEAGFTVVGMRDPSAGPEETEEAKMLCDAFYPSYGEILQSPKTELFSGVNPTI